MQTVSQAYLDSMASQLRNQSTAAMTIYNIDSTMQAAMTASGYLAAAGCDPSYVTNIKNTDQRKLATFERDYMRASGDYVLPGNGEPAVRYYVSNAISTVSANSSGAYDITACGVDIAFSDYAEWSIPPKISILTDGIIRGMTVTITHFSGTYTKNVVMDGNSVVLDDLPASLYYNSIQLRVTSLTLPERRARILRVYCGSLEFYDASDILSVSCVDVNDSLMLELPQKTMTTVLTNRYGITTLIDSANPRYMRFQTQLSGDIGYDIDGNQRWEYVSIGRWYLDGYTITDKEIRLSWVTALEVINHEEHLWSRTSNISLLQRFRDIMTIPNALEGPMGYIKTLPQRYGLTLDTRNLNLSPVTVYGICPIVTPAAALQLYANASGNKIVIPRTGDYDLQVTISSLNDPAVMTLSSFECFGDDAFDTGVYPGTVIVEVNQQSSTTSQQELANNAHVGHYATGYTSQKPISSVTIKGSTASQTGNSVNYAYATYVTQSDQSEDFMGTITATVRDALSTVYEYAAEARGETIKLSNPVITILNTAEFMAMSHYDMLRNTVSLTRRHRGYPPLDAGDTIAVDIEVGTVRAIVTENRWEFRSGAMSGSTKMRLLYGN